MNKWFVCVAALIVFVFPSGLLGADVAGLIDQAKTSSAAGKNLEAVDQLRQAMIGLWNQAPLTVRNVHLVEDQQGYGLYTPKGGTVFEPMEPIQIYCEAIGYTVIEKDGFHQFGLTADFTLTDSKGKVMGQQAGFSHWDIKSRSFNTEFTMDFTLNLKGLPPGKYVLAITLHDRNSKKTTSFNQPFSMK